MKHTEANKSAERENQGRVVTMGTGLRGWKIGFRDDCLCCRVTDDRKMDRLTLDAALLEGSRIFLFVVAGATFDNSLPRVFGREPRNRHAYYILVDGFFVVSEHTLFRTDRPHSFHLHGHSFYVVGEKREAFVKSAEHAKKLDSEGRLLRRKHDGAALKNTIVVPAAGVSAVRFVADNPGNCIIPPNSLRESVIFIVFRKRTRLVFFFCNFSHYKLFFCASRPSAPKYNAHSLPGFRSDNR